MIIHRFIEDPLGEDDTEGMQEFTKRFGVQIIATIMLSPTQI